MHGLATVVISLLTFGSVNFQQTPPQIVSPLPHTQVTPTPTPSPTPTPTPSPTPTPTIIPSPTPTPIVLTPNEFDNLFTKYSNEYSVDRSLLWKIAACESGLRIQAISGPYAGIYQFDQLTWRTTRGMMNMDPNPDLRFNPEEAIRTAAFKLSRDGARAWPQCGK